MWRLLPQLKDIPESLLKKLPLSAMFQLNSALAKENKTADKLGINSKLAKNSEKLAKHPVMIERGPDNRKDVLHPARFMGGRVASWRSSGSSLKSERRGWNIASGEL